LMEIRLFIALAPFSGKSAVFISIDATPEESRRGTGGPLPGCPVR
jgi:hypothetical protein